MMATTHALAGVAIAAVVSIVSPDVSAIAVGAAAAGGFFPDLDLYAGHRKTLHFPVYFSVAAGIATVVAAFDPTTLTVSAALFLVAASAHSVMDAFGGGLELRPWEATSDRGVYSHYHGRWIAPRRWIPYDGSPSDLALAALIATPTLVVFDAPVTRGVVVLLGVSAVYVLLRKPMVRIAEWVVSRTPARVRDYVPSRFIADLQ